MNLKSLKVKADSRSGVTLVELLVVILIVTILAVALLPLLQPFVVKAQYAAEAVPVLGNVRVKVGLFHYEKSYLPGTVLDNNITGGANTDTQRSSEIVAGEFVQSFVPYTKSAGAKNTVYLRGMLSSDATGLDDASTTAFANVDDDIYHFAKVLDLDYQEFTGRKFRPSDVQYVVPIADGSAYIYAIGAFGSGEEGGLPKGTGYAIIEIVDPTNQRKIIATWERYKPKDAATTTPLTFVISDNAPGTAAECAELGVVWVPCATYIGDNPGTTRDELLTSLALAGWDVTVPTAASVNP